MRKCGILMPVFSLPSRFGIGTLGAEAYRFVDFLKKAGQSYWQILPIGPVSYGDSPYQSFSAYAGNPYFIDLEMLTEEGLLTEAEVEDTSFGDDPFSVDYEALYKSRKALLLKACSRFKGGAEYNAFCEKNSFWLEEYSLFSALKSANGDAPWYEWEKSFRLREREAIEAAKHTYKDEMDFQRFIQYTFSKQWFALKDYANKNGIEIIGDIPIYVSRDSADVWSEQEQFLLDSDGNPTEVAGCPPDAFSEDGQLWGNPLYNWKLMKKQGFSWWCRRMKYALTVYDVVRIDHFRGFESFYAIPFGSKNAKNGKWKKGPDMALFRSFAENIGERLPIIAEDLGYLTPQVRKMLSASGYPGMKVLQFAFDGREPNDYLPHNYTRNCVVYTGTHDNDTVNGWAKTAPPADVEKAYEYLGVNSGESLAWSMMRAAMMSVADTCVLMMPDLIEMGSEGRINTPSTVGENWRWRIDGGCINDWLAKIIFEKTALYGRLPARPEEVQKIDMCEKDRNELP